MSVDHTTLVVVLDHGGQSVMLSNRDRSTGNPCDGIHENDHVTLHGQYGYVTVSTDTAACTLRVTEVR